MSMIIICAAFNFTDKKLKIIMIRHLLGRITAKK